jgi:hypothetical protein
MQTFDVSVSFELPAESEQAAIDFARELLEGLEQYDQLPYWYITAAEPVSEPDEAYHARIEGGETAPLTNAD